MTFFCFLGVPLLSQERVKLRTSNFVSTFIGSIGTKAHYFFGKLAVGVLRDSREFSGHPYIGRIAVIFAIAQLSRYLCRELVIINTVINSIVLFLNLPLTTPVSAKLCFFSFLLYYNARAITLKLQYVWLFSMIDSKLYRKQNFQVARTKAECELRNFCGQL